MLNNMKKKTKNHRWFWKQKNKKLFEKKTILFILIPFYFFILSFKITKMENKSKTNVDEAPKEKTFMVVSFDGFDSFMYRTYREPGFVDLRSIMNNDNNNTEPFETYVFKAVDKSSAYLQLVMENKYFNLEEFISMMIKYHDFSKFFESLPSDVQDKIKKEYSVLNFEKFQFDRAGRQKYFMDSMDLSWVTKDVAQKMWLFYNNPNDTHHDADDSYQRAQPYKHKTVAQLIELEPILEKIKK